MKETTDSDEQATVVSLIDFRNKKTKHPFKDMIYDDALIFGDDVHIESPMEFVEQMQMLVEALQDKEGEGNYDDLDVAIPRAEFVRMQTILAVLDDALQSLYHCHAVVTSDKMWTCSENIRNQMAQMTLYAEKHTKK